MAEDNALSLNAVEIDVILTALDSAKKMVIAESLAKGNGIVGSAAYGIPFVQLADKLKELQTKGGTFVAIPF